MKKYITTLIILLLLSCSSKPPMFYPFGDSEKQPLDSYPVELYRNTKIAIMPTYVLGNPNKLIDYKMSTEMQDFIKDLGFNVIDYNIVSTLIPNSNDNLSLSEYQEIQNKLQCQAILKTYIQYREVPAEVSSSSKAAINSSGGVANRNLEAIDTRYEKESMTLSLIDYTNYNTILSVSKYQSHNKYNFAVEWLVKNHIRKLFNASKRLYNPISGKYEKGYKGYFVK